MRFNSLLLVAVLIAYLHSSSTRSMMTSVNITEERTLNMPAIGESAEGITKKLSEAEEEMMKLSLQERPPKQKKPDESVQLDTDGTSQLRDVYLQLWYHFKEYPRINGDLATQMLTRLDDESAFKMLDALQKAKEENEVLENFKNSQIKYWEDQKKSSLDVFKLLKLDNTLSLYTPTELERFKMWIKFSTEKSDRWIVDVCKNFPFDMGLKILDGLRLIKDTQNVKIMEIVLVHRLPHGITLKYDILTAFTSLALDKGLEKLHTHRNVGLFNEFLRLRYPTVSKNAALNYASIKYMDELK